MTELSAKQVAKRDALLKVCKEYSGEYLPSHHGSGSWATTYSNQFADAATELWMLYRDAGSRWPILDLSSDFRGASIRSCRGAEMNLDRVAYLLEHHIAPRLERIESKTK